MEKRTEWLAGLTTRELVIYLMELRHAARQDVALATEVSEACAELRAELLSREWPTAVGS